VIDQGWSIIKEGQTNNVLCSLMAHEKQMYSSIYAIIIEQDFKKGTLHESLKFEYIWSHDVSVTEIILSLKSQNQYQIQNCAKNLHIL
jgi:hypothetical protein